MRGGGGSPPSLFTWVWGRYPSLKTLDLILWLTIAPSLIGWGFVTLLRMIVSGCKILHLSIGRSMNEIKIVMVKVYFETTNRLGVSTYAEVVAVFQDEELYSACLGVLEKVAKERGFDLVTESVVDEVDISDLK